LLFLGRIISGLTGASMTVASSYMADISNDENRSANFGMIGAAWGLGFISGPLLGGAMSFLGPTGPFLAAAALNLINFLFGLFVLPESLASNNRRMIHIKQLNPFASILKVLRPSPILGFIWVYFIIFLAGQVHPVNWTLYTQTKFQWTNWQVGLSLSFVGLMVAISQGGLTRVIIPKLGELRSFTFGVIVYVIGFALFAFASEGWMMYAIMVIFALSGVAMPALQSIIAKQIPANEQGELQGNLVALGSLSSILAPLLFTYLFVTFTSPTAPIYFPGAAYLGASALCVIALILNLSLGRKKK
jgi:DHA1 family tetracycline resistance protein-like MFS transporter